MNTDERKPMTADNTLRAVADRLAEMGLGTSERAAEVRAAAPVTPPVFLAMSDHAWGRGETIDEAKQLCKAHGGNLNRVVVFRLPDGATQPYVDDFGYVGWTWAPGYARTRSDDSLTVVYKRGVKSRKESKR